MDRCFFERILATAGPALSISFNILGAKSFAFLFHKIFSLFSLGSMFADLLSHIEEPTHDNKARFETITHASLKELYGCAFSILFFFSHCLLHLHSLILGSLRAKHPGVDVIALWMF
jgi:hypothetical protein